MLEKIVGFVRYGMVNFRDGYVFTRCFVERVKVIVSSNKKRELSEEEIALFVDYYVLRKGNKSYRRGSDLYFYFNPESKKLIEKFEKRLKVRKRF